MNAKRKPVYIEREQREALFQLLVDAERHRYSLIQERPDTAVVRRARRVVRVFDALTYTLNRRARDVIARESAKVREQILFGDDVRAALAAVKRFRAGK